MGDKPDLVIRITEEVVVIKGVGRGKYVRPDALKGRGHWEGSHYIKGSGATGNWTKWGGARQDAYQEEIADQWYCQSCNTAQPKELTPFKYEYPENEYLRVCAVCFATGCPDLRARANRSF